VASVKDIRGEVREFLTTRRAKITPERAGLPSYGGRRRVAGLRRDEVALLAGISIEYYTRLERGNIRGASAEVLDGIARALQLDEVERAHLADLVRTANAARPVRRRPDRLRVRPSVQRLLDSMTGTAAFVRNGRLDILSANQLGYALYAPVFDDPARPPNLARFIFLDDRSASFYRDWDGIAHQAVGSLRAEAGRDPYDRALTDLVGELSTRSQEFRVRWAGHDVKYYRSGVQPFRHPLAGDLDLDYDALEIPADPGLTIVAYSAVPGSPSAQAMRLLNPLSGRRRNRGNHPQAADRQGSGRVVHRRRVHRRHRSGRGALACPGERGQVHAIGAHRVALARCRADPVRHRGPGPGAIPRP
jgi:transcriptional regulator with XRE-family HTH domain